ncbi:MAG: protein kinase [Myxococcales bacterium]|nr:protein kinase [Myxococcales bacterium]
MEQFGKYQLQRRVGAGGMAEVYLARTTVAEGLSKQLVIKKIHPAFARSRQFVSMFVDEAKIALDLNHPNIVQVFDFGQVGQSFFLAMEFVEGVDVLRLMQETAKAGKRVPLDLAAFIVQQIARGLDYAHRKTDDFGEPLGIVHRDISPQNALVSWDGSVKIVDFGIARARDIKEEEGTIKGKFTYMPPEQARGLAVDRRADVFAAGVVLFELTCGRPLYKGKGKEVLEQARAGAIPAPRQINPDIPKDLEATILKALTYARDNRFQTGRDLQNALGRFQFQWAQSHRSMPPDSGSLAQWLARTVPKGGGDFRKHRETFPGTPAAIEQATSQLQRTRANPPGMSVVDDSERDERFKPLRERKPVFIIDGKLSGLGQLVTKVGADRASEIVADFCGVARDIAFKHNATLGPTNETKLRVLLGVPAAGDDDGTRTIRLARSLIEALDGIGSDVEPALRLAVGIERGTALVTRDSEGRYGYELEEEADVSAADVLSGEARGAEVLVTSEVFRVCQGDFNFEPIARTSGSARPHRIYRLRGPKERQQRLRERSEGTNLIGRDLELKALKDAYREALVHGAHKLMVVTGEPGIGKRSLVNALLASIPKGEASVMRATARAGTKHTPFGIIADFGRDAMGLAETAEPKEIRKRIEMLAQVLWPGRVEETEIRGFIDAACTLFGLRREGSPNLDPKELRSRLREVAHRIEQKFSPDHPLIVVAENVHWADEQSMLLNRDLLEISNSRGVFLLITARPEPSIVSLAKESSVELMNLLELGEDDRHALIERRFAPGEDIHELVRQILTRTGGNPFFIMEILDSLIERGILTQEEIAGRQLLRWRRGEEPIQIPTSVETLLATRIDQLDHELKPVLAHASVLGSRFDTEQLLGLMGSVECERIDETLQALVEKGLLRVDKQGHAFANDMTMTVAYRMVPGEDRTRLHRLAAERLEANPGAVQRRAYIAHHLELAGESKAAADAYLAAATHAMHVGSTGDALHQLSRCLKLYRIGEHANRFTVHLLRVDALGRLAKRPKQLREIEALMREASHLGGADKLACAHARLTEFRIEQGKIAEAVASVAPALRYAREANDKLAEAEALRLQSSIYRLQGKSAPALQTCDEALALAQSQPGALGERAQILNNRGTILWNMNRLNEAIECYAETLVIYKNLGRPRQEARALNNMGIVFSALGESEAALGHYKRSLRIDQRLGDRAQIALKLGNIGQTYTELGDDVRGEKYLLKALKLSEAHQDWGTMIDILNSLGQVYLGRCDLDRATSFLTRGLDHAREAHNHYQEIRSLVYLALAGIESGEDLEVAREQAARATEIARHVPMPVGEMLGLSAQALACEKLGELARGLELSRLALVHLEKIEQGEGLESILQAHATLCDRNGLTDEARSAIARSRQEVERKAAKLIDSELRACYLASPAISKIFRQHELLCGADSDV